MGKHTPGPWECSAGYGNHGLALTGPHGESLGHVRAFVASGDYARGLPIMQKWSEGQANARLIAAAPELVAALEIIADGNTDPDRMVQIAAEAVAKVRG